jgi:hypothetical protein
MPVFGTTEAKNSCHSSLVSASVFEVWTMNGTSCSWATSVIASATPEETGPSSMSISSVRIRSRACATPSSGRAWLSRAMNSTGRPSTLPPR